MTGAEMALVSHSTSSDQAAMGTVAEDSGQQLPLHQTVPQQLNVNQSTPSRAVSAPVHFQRDAKIGQGSFGIVTSGTDFRSGMRLACKKMVAVFQNLAYGKRVYREIKMLSSFKHDNVISLVDIERPQDPALFAELNVMTELMESDLNKVIVSLQPLSVEHIKLFMYQMLRGLKYIHSANIIHRDIKPANLLINSNCLLKICDFGLARIWNAGDNAEMTHEVVTQYYRPPELLLGARKYTAAIDMWSVGCVLAELMSRKILFQASGMEQLHLIMDLIGTPAAEDIPAGSVVARNHILNRQRNATDTVQTLMMIAPGLMTNEAADLIIQLLTFNPEKRPKVCEALRHSYLRDGLLRFHNSICSCCYDLPSGEREYSDEDSEPIHREPFDSRWERELARCTMSGLRSRIYGFVSDLHQQQ